MEHEEYIFKDFPGRRLEDPRPLRCRPPRGAGQRPSRRGRAVTLIGAQVTRRLSRNLEIALGVRNLSQVQLADVSPLFTDVEPPRSWRLTLRGRW